ncbi:MAG: hypothetical protein ACR2RL_23280, partial [Gammaproteobacteria bacterium]
MEPEAWASFQGEFMVSDDAPERKLAVILHADVANYTRWMQRDEIATHRRVTEYFDLLDQTIQ